MSGETPEEKFAFTEAVFRALADQRQEARISKGLRLRQKMHEAIKAGVQPQGYRPEWLRAQAQELAKVLGRMAEAFDAAHPDDQATVSDILDVLATTAHLFRTHASDE